ncbi:MAG: site-specific DNA-methyltransferase [Verrucomicrobia bacterium]|nr:site-specific DNA-methyltransferase [Verrucomicrobiota bacterium]
MKPATFEPPRERKTAIIHFRVPAAVAASLAAQIDPASGLQSVNDVARALTMQALAERERHRQLRALDVYNLKDYALLDGDAGRLLPHLPARAFRTCITSPPYWRQRNYGNHPEQLGQERAPEEYINRLADIFTHVHRALADDGTLWLNIDDSYHHKELVGIPWRLALELQRRGWHWRAEIVWAKASTPEPVKDRPTRAHEAVLMFSKKRNYFYNYDAILEPHDSEWAVDCIRKAQASGLTGRPKTDPFSKDKRKVNGMQGITRAEYGTLMNPNGKNKRDVWTINTEKFRGAHSAVMPVALARVCVLAGSQPGDVVLDPFAGTGTTGAASLENGRRFVGIDLVPRFIRMAHERLKLAAQSQP